MSFKNTNTNNNKKQEKTFFCKVCYDAKRSDYNTHFLKDFTGPSPVVTCPYLLALKCNYCKMTGHTVSYCDVLKSKKEAEEDAPIKSNNNRKKESQNGSFFILRVSEDGTATHAPTTPAPSTPPRKQQTTQYTARALVNPGRNKFVLLADDEEEEAEEELIAAVAAVSIADEATQEDTWAKIVSRAPITKKSVTFGNIPPIYKHQITQAINEPRAAEFEKPWPTFIHVVTKGATSVVKESAVKNLFAANYRPGRSWADDSSDDEDEDEKDGGWGIM
jgi:hypothetical protein